MITLASAISGLHTSNGWIKTSVWFAPFGSRRQRGRLLRGRAKHDRRYLPICRRARSQTGPQYAKTADTVAITAAVSALVHVTLGRRLLVWGGQPAITPMIWVIAEGLGIEYGGWVKLYQSKHFKEEYPEDNQRFQNITYTDDVGRDREHSLQLMRERMFRTSTSRRRIHRRMGGIVQEFDLLQQLQPNAAPLPVISTGVQFSTLRSVWATCPPTSGTIWIM